MNNAFTFARAFVARTKKPITVLVALVALSVLLIIAAPVAIALLAAAVFAYVFYLIYTGDAKVLKVVDKLLAVVNWVISVISKVAQKVHDYVHNAAQGASADASVARVRATAKAASGRYGLAVRTRVEADKAVSDIDQLIFELHDARDAADRKRADAARAEQAALSNAARLTQTALRLAQERDEHFPRK